MDNVKISIIVPVYNGERYLRPLLDSIVFQTSQNFEVVVIDDGSTDNSLEILNEYREKIHNLTVISQKNSGVSIARNNGIKAAKGEYFCFCDADDVLSPDYIRIFSEVIDKFSPDMGVCDYKPFYADNIPKTDAENPKVENLYALYKENVFNELSKMGLSTQIGNKFYKTSLVKNLNIEFTKGVTYGEDMFFNWKVLMASKSVVKIDCSLYFYRMVDGSASVKYHPNLYGNYKNEYKKIIDFAKQIGFDEDKIYNDIYENLIARIPALLRMVIRKKSGFLNARKDIISIADDDLMTDALNHCQVDGKAKKLKEKKIASLYFSAFKEETRISLARKIKNFKGAKR